MPSQAIKPANDPLLLSPCPNCGSQLLFDAAKQSLVCRHCHTTVAIERSSDQVLEMGLKQQLSGDQQAVAEVEQLVYQCTRCGSESIYNSEVPTFTCSFCNFEVVNPQAYKTRLIQPSGIIPFGVEEQKARALFKTWLGNSFWAPNDLAAFARADALRGIYLPFWTYDAQTASQWQGYGGRYYYVTESYTDSDGKRQTRQVRHTEWIFRSGDYNHFFDDILIGGSDELNQQESENIFPYNLQELVNFDASYLSGWSADVYEIDVHKGYDKAESIMHDRIHAACADLCTIDTYRDLEVSTVFSQQTYKHILLPIWLCSYRYKEKTYHFIVNGQTGKISGKKPVSLGKVVLAILAVIAAIAVIMWVVNSRQ